MPKRSEERITAQPGVTQSNAQSSRQIKQQVFAPQADNVPNYLPSFRDGDSEALLRGLAQFQPVLMDYATKDASKMADTGEADRIQGKEAQSSNSAYRNSYFHTDGLVKGQEDGGALLAEYNTTFDKDKGDLERWLGEHNQKRVGAINDEHYQAGYQNGVMPAYGAIRKAHTEYQTKAVETKVESNAMQLLDNGVRAYTSQSQEVPEGYISTIRDYMGKNLGVSGARFNDLLFATVQKVGDEGHFDAYEVLKKDNPDGSPGMYYDPAWKRKIDAAQEASFTTSRAVAQADRDNRQQAALFPVFLEEDPKKAQEMYAELRKGNLFTRADDLIKWDKLMVEKADGKPDARQMDNEVKYLSRIYEGKMGIRQILDLNASGDITSGQRKYLIGIAHTVSVENRTLAATNGKAEEAIFKTKEYADAKDYVSSALAPRPKDPAVFNLNTARETEFDKLNQAQAQREFFTNLKGKKPDEVQAVADEIITRYKARQKQMSPDQQSAVTSNTIPFRSLAEARAAAAKGMLSPAELRRYITHFQGS